MLKHLHDEKSEICLVNTLLTLPVRSAEEVEDDNWRQWELEAEARSRREQITYAEQVFGQAFGPTRKLLVPLDVRRRSRSLVFDMALRCPVTAVAVDFEVVKNAISGNERGQAAEELPLEMAAMLW